MVISRATTSSSPSSSRTPLLEESITMIDNTPNEPTPNAVVAVYTTEADLTTAVKHLERRGFDMSMISVLGQGMSS
jgi:hypothetical protein